MGNTVTGTSIMNHIADNLALQLLLLRTNCSPSSTFTLTNYGYINCGTSISATQNVCPISSAMILNASQLAINSLSYGPATTPTAVLLNTTYASPKGNARIGDSIMNLLNQNWSSMVNSGSYPLSAALVKTPLTSLDNTSTFSTPTQCSLIQSDAQIAVTAGTVVSDFYKSLSDASIGNTALLSIITSSVAGIATAASASASAPATTPTPTSCPIGFTANSSKICIVNTAPYPTCPAAPAGINCVIQ